MLPFLSFLGPMVGGIVGNIAGAGDRSAAQQAMDEALAEIESIGAGPDLARDILLEKFHVAGVLTPEIEQNISAVISQVSQIQEDPSLREAQLSALDLLKQRSETGLSATDRVRLTDIRNDVAKDNQARTNDIINNLNARGQAGSGAEIALRMQAAQSGSNRASEEADRAAAMANEAALAALSQYGDMSGKIRGQDFDVANTKASAADEFNRFNTQNQIAVQSRNVDRNNSAAQFNLTNKQNVSDRNVVNANSELNRQRDAEQTMFDNKYKVAKAKADALQGKADNDRANANATSSAITSVGAGIGGAAAGYGQYQNQQKQFDLDSEKLRLEREKLELLKNR